MVGWKGSREHYSVTINTNSAWIIIFVIIIAIGFVIWQLCCVIGITDKSKLNFSWNHLRMNEITFVVARLMRGRGGILRCWGCWNVLTFNATKRGRGMAQENVVLSLFSRPHLKHSTIKGIRNSSSFSVHNTYTLQHLR